jgi:hypothetical protein
MIYICRRFARGHRFMPAMCDRFQVTQSAITSNSIEEGREEIELGSLLAVLVLVEAQCSSNVNGPKERHNAANL